jgi:acetyltransferase-like isoleucine patch superfamily enzyme
MTQDPRFTSLADKLQSDRSSFAKYRDLMVGHRGFLYFLKYEIITFFFSQIPGGIGFVLRKWFYPLLFDHIGKGVIFGKNLVLRHPHQMKIGNHVVIDENCLLIADEVEGIGITIGDNVILSRNSILMAKGGRIEIGENSNIGSNCFFGTTNRVTVGKNVLIAANGYVGGGRYKYDRLDLPPMKQEMYSVGEQTIGDNVWLGANVIVIDGINVGHDSIIGAGAVVTRDVPPYSIAAGVPARVIKSRAENPEKARIL